MQSLTLPDNSIIEARKNNLRYIISGGPGFGKTSIIHELENRKFKSIHEISRSIIKEQLEKGGTILPWKDLAAFIGRVLEQRLQQHSQVMDEHIHFYERGMVDVLAYLIKDNLPIPPHYIKAAQVNHYNQLVFLTPPWKEIYLIDNERKEDFSNAEQIHNLIENTYRRLGYQTLNIPMMEVNKRVDFILDTIQQHNQK